MNLLNHRMMFPNEKTVLDETTNTESIETEIPEDTINEIPNDDVVSNNKIDMTNPTQIDTDNTIPVEAIRNLDDIEQDIINDQIDKFDEISECITEINRLMNNVSVMLESATTNSHLSQYTLLSRSDYEDGMMDTLFETTMSSLWETFLETIKKFIAKAKELIAKITFNVANTFNVYGKYNEHFKKAIEGKTINGNHTIEFYSFDRNKICSETKFNRLHEFAATVIGNAMNEDAMKQKLDSYESNNWTDESVYNYIAGKCIGKKISGKNDVQQEIMNSIKDPNPQKGMLSDALISYAMNGLDSVKDIATKYASQSKASILNPEFENIYKEINKCVKSEKSDTNSIKYKYYKTRYQVFTIAQRVALDIYNAKVKCIREYANQCVRIEKEYLSNCKIKSV